MALPEPAGPSLRPKIPSRPRGYTINLSQEMMAAETERRLLAQQLQRRFNARAFSEEYAVDEDDVIDWLNKGGTLEDLVEALPKRADLPGSRTLQVGAEAAAKNLGVGTARLLRGVGETTAGLAASAVQAAFVPGTQEVEKLAAKYREQGVPTIEAALRAYREADLPWWVRLALEAGTDPLNLIPIPILDDAVRLLLKAVGKTARAGVRAAGRAGQRVAERVAERLPAQPAFSEGEQFLTVLEAQKRLAESLKAEVTQATRRGELGTVSDLLEDLAQVEKTIARLEKNLPAKPPIEEVSTRLEQPPIESVSPEIETPSIGGADLKVGGKKTPKAVRATKANDELPRKGPRPKPTPKKAEFRPEEVNPAEVLGYRTGNDLMMETVLIRGGGPYPTDPRIAGREQLLDFYLPEPPKDVPMRNPADEQYLGRDEGGPFTVAEERFQEVHGRPSEVAQALQNKSPEEQFNEVVAGLQRQIQDLDDDLASGKFFEDQIETLHKLRASAVKQLDKMTGGQIELNRDAASLIVRTLEADQIYPIAGGAGRGNKTYDRLMKMWDDASKRPSQTFQETIKAWKNQFEFLWSDNLVSGNAIDTKFRQWWTKNNPGQPIPPEMKWEVLSTRYKGVPTIATQMLHDTMRRVRQTIHRTPINLNDVAALLKTRHEFDKLRAKPERQIAGGFSVEELAGLEAALRERLGPENFQILEDAAREVIKTFDDLLEQKVAAGVIPAKWAKTLRQRYPWYFPTKYFKDLEDALINPTEQVHKKLSGRASRGIDPLTEFGSEELDRPIWEVLPDTVLKSNRIVHRNRAVKGLIDEMLSLPDEAAQLRQLKPGEAAREGMGRVAFFRDGTFEVWEVPILIKRTIDALEPIPLPALLSVSRAINNFVKLGITTLKPGFWVSNMAVDTLTVMIKESVGLNDLAVGLVKSLKDVAFEDPLLAQMRREGLGSIGFLGKDPDQVAARLKKKGVVVIRGPKDAAKLLANPMTWLDGLEKIGTAIEMAPRAATVRAKLAQGATLEDAVLAARRATIDFSRHGHFGYQLNTIMLYANASIQGTLLPFRALRDSPRARWGTAAFVAMTAGLYAWNSQFPEYWALDDETRYSGIPIMYPSNEFDDQGRRVMKAAVVVPNDREWALFGAPTIRLLELLTGKAPSSTAHFLATVAPNATPFGVVQGGIGFPSVTEPLYELAINRNTFSGKAIVPADLRNLPKEQQKLPWTSRSAAALAERVGQSPVQVEYLTRNMFGSLTSYPLDLADWILDRAKPPDIDPEVAANVVRLREITEQTPPERRSVERSRFLQSLDPAMRELVTQEEFVQENPSELPLVGELRRKFTAEVTSAQVARVGRERAAEELGIDPIQTAASQRLIGKAVQAYQLGLQEIESQILRDAPGKTPADWRAARRDMAIILQEGVYRAAQIAYPGSLDFSDPQARQKFFNLAYTAGGVLEDAQDEGQLLYTAYHAIPLEEDDLGDPDFDQQYQQQQEFLAGLTPEQRKRLEEWEDIYATTPMERRWKDDREVLRRYFALPETVLAGRPTLLRAWEDMKDMTRSERSVFLQLSSEAKLAERTVKYERQKARLDSVHNPTGAWSGLDDALLFWEYADTPITRQTITVPRLTPARQSSGSSSWISLPSPQGRPVQPSKRR